jgi:lipopolysaccharide export system protein LptC
MRTLVIIALVIALMFTIGWLTWRNNGEQAVITLETKKIQHDTEHVIDQGKELMHNTGESIKHSGQSSTPAPRNMETLNQ